MAVSFNLPDPYEAQKQDIARRQKYAEALQQQAFQPTEPFSYQGIQAPIPVTASLAKVLAGLGGAYLSAEGAREQRELREGDIKKGQEFAAALQGAKTPEDRQALATTALGGTLGQRAQAMAGPLFSMAETARDKELAREAATQKARDDRLARAEIAEANRELRATIAAGQQQTAQILAGGRLEAQREGLQLRAEALERQRQEDARRAAQLSEAERRQVFQQQDQIDAGQSTLSLLAQAGDLSGKFRGGAGAGTTAYLESQARSLVGMAPSEESNALINYDNLVKEQALGQLKSTFGGNPTEGERKVLLDLQASSGKTPEQRAAILDRAIALAQDRIKGAEQRRESLLTRSYRQPAGAQPPAPAAPAAPAAPGAPRAPAAPAAPSAPATNIPQAAIDALRAGRGTREQFDAAFGAGAAARVLGR
jgi:hypothetical protein